MPIKKYNFTNLVFEGGGVKGIAYIGALKVLEEKNILKNINRIAGTSAGAITAALLALNFTTKEIENILQRVDFNSFKDDSFLIIRDIFRLLRKYGWYKGDVFKKWFENIISQKANKDLTFGQLKKLDNSKELYLIGTDINYKSHVVLSHETTPNMKIVDAVRISMSIPLFFKAVNYKKSLYVDGGVYYNYPLNLFDNEKYLPEKKDKFNKQTLGFRVDSTEEISSQITKEPLPNLNVNSFQTYIQALIGGLVDFANKTHLNEKDWHRTVFIDSLGISTTQFDLTKEQKQALIQSGIQGAQKYFNWFDKSKGRNKPLNK